MGKNKDRKFQSNLLDRAPVTEESHIDSKATAQEPVAAESKEEVTETPAAAPAEQKPDHGFYEETKPRTYGRVNSKCKKLNVRRAPSATAEVLLVVNSGREVRIFKDESTDKFYKISLDAGVTGFVMKEFIDEV